MREYVPSVMKPDFDVQDTPAQIWDTSPWPTVMMWSLFLNTAPNEMLDDRTWQGSSDDVDFCLARVQPEAVAYLQRHWHHPVLTLRDWFDSPEAQQLLYRRAIAQTDPDTPLGRLYKAPDNIPYKQRVAHGRHEPVYVHMNDILGLPPAPTGHHAHTNGTPGPSPAMPESDTNDAEDSPVETAPLKRRKQAPMHRRRNSTVQ
jgi:hypothetical protein